MNSETRGQLQDLAEDESYVAFKSAARACGLSSVEANRFYDDIQHGVVLDVRDSGAELRDGDAWLMSTVVVDVED